MAVREHAREQRRTRRQADDAEPLEEPPYAVASTGNGSIAWTNIAETISKDAPSSCWVTREK